MIINPRDKAICKKYGKQVNGKYHCNECPLRKGTGYDMRCKANSHYNYKTKEWEWD